MSCGHAFEGQRQRDAVDDRDGGRRIFLESHCLRHAEQFARRDVANHDLLSLRRHLLDPEMSMQQHEKRMRFRALVEHAAVLRIPDRSRFAQDGVEIAGAQSGEDGDVGDDGTVEGSH